MCGSATSHHAPVAHMVYLANQKDTGRQQLETRQVAANQNELRQNSMYNVVMSHWK